MMNRNFRVKNNKLKILNMVIGFVFIANPMSHFFKNTLLIGDIYYSGYICWTLLFITLACCDGRIDRNVAIICGFFVLSLFIGSCFGELYFKSGFENVHISLLIGVAIISTMGFRTSSGITRKSLIEILNIVVAMGVFASFYAMIIQRESVLNVLSQNNMRLYSWKYVSFFRQRNIFAGYCFATSIAALYLFASTRKMRYFLCLILFGFQIFLTNSRTSLLAYAICVVFFIYKSRKNKFLFTVMAGICFIVVYYAFELDKILLERFVTSHTTLSGSTSGKVRLDTWTNCLKYLYSKNILIIICGFGSGAINEFLTPIYEFGSSHNVYIDAVFNGGIVYLSIILWAIYTSFKNIKDKNMDREFVIVWESALYAYTFYCLLEAGMTPFTSNYFSLTITVLLFMIPRFYNSGQSDRRYQLEFQTDKQQKLEGWRRLSSGECYK